MNTTPIEKCYIGADAQYDVEVAAANGWSNFSIYPNGRLIGTSPAGINDEPVPQYASYLKERAPKLLAALKTVTALARIKYGNLDADADAVLTDTEKMIASMEK